MQLAELLELMQATPPLPALLKSLERPGVHYAFSGLVPPARAILLAVLRHRIKGPILWISPNYDRAERLYDDLAALTMEASPSAPAEEPALLFPEPESSLFDAAITDPLRLAALHQLHLGAAPIVLAPVRALLIPTWKPSSLEQLMTTVYPGDSLPPEEFAARLVEAGCNRVSMVERRGEFSIRGCIIDLYPGSGAPVRVELWGDEVESIRTLDLASQRSGQLLEELSFLPLRETPQAGFLTDYFPPGCLCVIDEPARVKLAVLETVQGVQGFTWEGPGISTQDQLAWRDLAARLAPFTRLDLSSWQGPVPGPQIGDESTSTPVFDSDPDNESDWGLGDLESFSARIEPFLEGLRTRRSQGQRILLITRQESRFREILHENDMPGLLGPTQGMPGPGEIQVASGALSGGFFHPQLSLAVYTDREVLGSPRRRTFLAVREAERPLRPDELHPGDLVVHLQHGIGLFRGLCQMKVEGINQDFLHLEYGNGDKLYVPVDHLHLVGKYVGGDARTPSLSLLGGKRWSVARRKVEEAVEQIARELLEVQARREAAPGHAFSLDTHWQAEMEAAFPFEETPDQERAIMETKADMEKPRPMDRLVCGDAGYGKTEVALRAAFKVVMDNHQVAILVPTTVLAQQHHNFFQERLAPFPIKIEVLSRFRSSREQKAVVEGLAAGTVDIVIGTHRLLQKDVNFQNLGLVIIDEEQHFGVSHKEKLKALRATVDILTLTATPIPRTLHFALSGMRELNIINTPPRDRLPIRTYLFEYHPEVIAGAIERELARDGQIYLVHNRVQGIERLAEEVRRLVPRARVAVAHGQLPEERLERIMLEFLEGQYDILVCTTIIESGLDIPNVNTIIINQAHRFGLSQLYQLRGRVGRSHHQAYAYLLYPPHYSLSAEAVTRLETLRELTAPGSGFAIALRDLEIRGAGNLLGAEQSGNIAAVGFDLYCRLLAEAVQALKQEPLPATPAPVKLDLPLEANLPDYYISDSVQKLALYRRMVEFTDQVQVEELRSELRDRFGPLPEEAENLLAGLRLRIAAARSGVEAISGTATFLVADWRPGREPQYRLLRQAAKTVSGSIQPAPSRLIYLPAGPIAEGIKDLELIMEALAGG